MQLALDANKDAKNVQVFKFVQHLPLVLLLFRVMSSLAGLDARPVIRLILTPAQNASQNSSLLLEFVKIVVHYAMYALQLQSVPNAPPMPY